MKNKGKEEGFPGTVPTKKYTRRKGRQGYHQGCFGKQKTQRRK